MASLGSVAAVMKRIVGDAGRALTILFEALAIPCKNRQLVMGVVLLALPHAGFFLLRRLLVYPYFDKIPEVMLLVDFLLWTVDWALDLFTAVITTFAALAACSGELSSSIELLKGFFREWRGPVLTVICIYILQGGYWRFVHFIFGGSLPVFRSFPLNLCFHILFWYLDAAWESSLPVSVEDQSSGFSALSRATQLTKGSRLQGFYILFFWELLYQAIDLISSLPGGIAMPSAAHLALAACFSCLPALMNMLRAAAFAVFYRRCRSAEQIRETESHYTPLC